MTRIKLKIDGVALDADADLTIMEAARRAGIYIPALCSHPDLPPFHSGSGSQFVYQGPARTDGSIDPYEGCGMCLVEVEGDGIRTACDTLVQEGMTVFASTPEINDQRQENLKKILSGHPHACLVCPQQEGCGQKSCSSNVPEDERCCPNFNVCELKKVSEYVGMRIDIPPYVPQGLSVVDDEPFFRRDYNLCIACTRCVRVCNDVRGVGALAFTTAEGRLIVGTTGPTLKDSGCRFCGACVEVCPTGALMDKDIVWSEREEALVPCKNACPAGIDIPLYVRLMAEGDFAGAAAVVREKVPFPATLGRVCFHPCEDVCRRKMLGKPVAIRELKRCAADLDEGFWKERDAVADRTGKKTAIVGSGPAGMTCAYYLARQGHSVVIFEALAHPGGMLRYGIPEYRLPKETLDREIDYIRQFGVEIKTDTRVESLDDIFEQGFDSVFLAMGLQGGARIGIEGEDLPEVVDGISFLRKANSKKSMELGPRVAVIGGGNVAMDASRTALRVGAKEVTILYRRGEAEMPAYVEEIEQAVSEGVKIEFLAIPRKISKTNGRLDMECLRMALGDADMSGRRRPVPVENSRFNMVFDDVIVAVGQKSSVPEGFDVSLGAKGYPVIDPETLSTSRKGVFAGGDLVSGASTVVEAIAMGKKAAAAMDQFLGGEGNIERRLIEQQRPNGFLGKANGFSDLKRVTVQTLNVSESIGNFDEIVCGYDRDQAMNEAKRCLRCDLRLEISSPVMPPEMWTEFTAENIESVPNTEGVFQLFDADKRLICIKGAMNMFEGIEEKLRSNEKTRFFLWEEDPMYTKRESELLQQYMQEHGAVPDENAAELDDDLY